MLMKLQYNGCYVDADEDNMYLLWEYLELEQLHPGPHNEWSHGLLSNV